MTESDIDARLSRDLYVALGEDVGNAAWSVRVQYKPLVRLIWLGALIMACGGLVAVSGSERYRRCGGSPRPRRCTRSRRRPDAALLRAGSASSSCCSGFLYVGLVAASGRVHVAIHREACARAPALDLCCTTRRERALSSADFAGRTVAAATLWAAWCVACREEHPAAARDRTHEGRADVRPRLEGRSRELHSRQLQRLGDPYDAVGFDSEGRVAIDWGVYGAPETFLLDANGTVVLQADRTARHGHLAQQVPALDQRREGAVHVMRRLAPLPAPPHRARPGDQTSRPWRRRRCEARYETS